MENIHIEKEVILKWEVFIIEAFLFLQKKLTCGGTYSNKVGPIWNSQKSIKEKYEWHILKLINQNIDRIFSLLHLTCLLKYFYIL